MPDDSMVEKEQKNVTASGQMKRKWVLELCVTCLWIFIQNSVAVTVYREKLRRY